MRESRSEDGEEKGEEGLPSEPVDLDVGVPRGGSGLAHLNNRKIIGTDRTIERQH